MITNDYIKGYLAALRTIENAMERVEEIAKLSSMSENDLKVGQDYANGLMFFIQDQRKSYKELVDKLNKENK